MQQAKHFNKHSYTLLHFSQSTAVPQNLIEAAMQLQNLCKKPNLPFGFARAD
jgi:uncharacterized protein (UPF0147 family)